MKYLIKKTKGYVFIEKSNVIYSAINSSKKAKYIKQLFDNKKLIGETELKYKFPFSIFHEIRLIESNEVIKLNYKNILKPEYKCFYNKQHYSIYPHKGTLTSIFKNDKQIAFFKENLVEYMGKHQITLIVNQNENVELLFLFIMALLFDFNNDYSNASLNLGNITFEAKEFNYKWKPI